MHCLILVLTGLLSSLLRIPPESITNIRIKNAILPGQKVKGMEYRLDILMEINHLQIINLEMQVINYGNWPERSLCYLSRVYDNLNRGGEYSTVRPAMLIGILDFQLFSEEPRFYSLNKMMDVDTHHVYSDKFAIHVLCLNQEDLATEVDRQWGLVKWTKLFKAKTWEDIKMIAKNNIYLTETANSMFALCDDEEIQRQCHDREVNINFYRMQQLAFSNMKDELQEKNSVIAKQHSDLAAKDSLITKQHNDLAEKDSLITKQHSDLAEKDSLITKQSTELAEAKALIAQLQAQISENKPTT